jgi:HSP20 family protein
MLNTWNAVATLDRMFDDVMGSAFGTATNSRTFDPAVDVRANDTEVCLVWDMPGIKREDLEITLANHVLTVKGTRRFDGKQNEQVMLGRPYGSFTRAYTLPESLDEQQLSADLADGVLTVRIPKLPEAQPRKIPIGQAASPKQLAE